MCPKMRPMGVAKKRKKGQTFLRQTGCPDHPRRRRPLKFCMLGRVREVVIYFKFMKIGRGVSELWRVENLPLPLTWPMANSLSSRDFYIHCISKQPPLYILNNFAKNEPILIIFGVHNHEKISHQIIKNFHLTHTTHQPDLVRATHLSLGEDYYKFG